MQYDSKWASSYANFGIALQFISECSSGCGFVKLFKKFPRPEDIKIIKLLEIITFKTQIILIDTFLYRQGKYPAEFP